jgi:transposase
LTLLSATWLKWPVTPPAEQPGLLAVPAQVADPRHRRGVRHRLAGILGLALCAVVAGARSFTAIAEWAAGSRGGKTGKGNPYLKGVLGEAAAAAARTDTFLGERYRRIVKRRGKLKALVAVARSILVIIWNLLTNPAARYRDLGAGYHASRIDKGKKVRNHIRQLEALGYTVALTEAA